MNLKKHGKDFHLIKCVSFSMNHLALHLHKGGPNSRKFVGPRHCKFGHPL